MKRLKLVISLPISQQPPLSFFCLPSSHEPLLSRFYRSLRRRLLVRLFLVDASDLDAAGCHVRSTAAASASNRKSVERGTRDPHGIASKGAKDRERDRRSLREGHTY